VLRRVALPILAHEVQRISTRVPYGDVFAEVSWAVDDEQTCDILRGRIEYRPDNRLTRSCSSIRFIQIVKTIGNDGRDYQWQGLEQRRNLLRTSAQIDAGVEPRYFVDHQAYACQAGAPCSPYFRDYWANSRESRDGFQANSGIAPASLVDYPFGWEIPGGIALESCARCVDTGEFLGCVEWGARWPLAGDRSISPIRVRATPSPTFFAALRIFEQVYPRSHP